MKYLILIGDGMADFPLEELGDKTPLEAASTPAMDEVAQEGICGLFCPIPEGLPAGSDIGNLSLFGYDPRSVFTGRAPIEAANQGIHLSDAQVAFRCNLVTLGDGVMQSFTSDHISSEEGAALIATLNEALAEYPVELHPGVGYRHLGVFTAGDCSVDELVAAQCTPPHDISDREYESHLPQGDRGAALLRAIMNSSQSVLADHPVNKAREEAGKLPATSMWLWGQGQAPKIDLYRERFGIGGAVVSAVDLVKGMGVCAGLDVLEVEGATGYVDTNYAGKVAASLEALERDDFVYLHVEAPDEAGHEGRAPLKIQAIEDFDQKVVAPCLAYAKSNGDTRVLVAPDHVTAISTKTHAGGPVPFALCGTGVAGNGASAYSETAGAHSGLLVQEGHALVPAIIESSQITADSLAGLDS